MTNIDCVILNVPGTLSRSILAAPALLKAVLLQHGFTCRVIDYNIRFLRDFEQNERFSQLENYFLTGSSHNALIESLAKTLVDQYVVELCTLKPKYVAISVFTFQSRTATKLFCEGIRRYDSKIKIVIGGQGLSTGINGEMDFALELRNNGLIDHFIKSEGEISLPRLLQNKTDWPGINSTHFIQNKDIDSLPVPDYDDYDFSLYDQPIGLPITGSRGCVRKCTFCDIHQHWKYTWRTGQSIAHEIIKQNQRYGIQKFTFTDSLINGNIKEFNIMIEILRNYNLENPMHAVSWGGQFIVQAKDTVQSEIYWRNLKESGAESLALGIESGSESVRNHMKKQFSNADLDYTMSMFDKYQITCRFMLILGYPTETLEDFEMTLDMLRRYQHLAGNVITKIELGSTLAVLPGSPLYDMRHDLDIELDRQENNWISFKNPDLSLEERLRRRAEAKNLSCKLGYNTQSFNDNFVEDYLFKNLKDLNTRTELRKKIKIKQQSTTIVL